MKFESFCFQANTSLISFDDTPLPSKAKAVAASPFNWAAPASSKSFDDLPLPTNKNSAPIGFSQIAQRSKSSSICFGSQVQIETSKTA
jgi:hypothetical protein